MRRTRFVLGSIVTWVIAVGFVTLLLRGQGLDLSVLPGLPLVVGIALGLLGALYELFWLPRIVHRLTSRGMFLGRTLFYAGAAGVAVTVLSALAASAEFDLPLRTVLAAPVYHEMIGGRLFWTVIGLLALASVWINYTRQVRLMLGPGTLRALLFGRYARPVPEERVFLFADLTDSTGIAERLGPALFNQFKNDFFYDVSEPVLATRGQIYQYVGDEVVVTWPVRKGRATGNALQAFALLENHLTADRARYEARYGVAPTFKAGIHVGPVVTAEVGDLKKDIVHSGDTVNAASRIVGQCRKLDARLLVSEAAMQLLETPDGLTLERLGPVALRGRGETIVLFRAALPSLVTPEPVKEEALTA